MNASRMNVVVCWAGLIGLAGCSSEWVERQIPDEPAAPVVTPRQEAEQADAREEEGAPAEPARGVPEGMGAVVLAFPAVQSRHIEAGAILDIFATKMGEREGPSGSEIAGVLVMRDLEVAANVCGPEVCSVKVFVPHQAFAKEPEALVVLAAREDVTLHPWVRVDGARGDDRSARGNLRDAIMDMEVLHIQFDGFAERGLDGEHLVRLSLEIGLDAHAIELVASGATGELLVTFEIDQDPPTGEPLPVADFVTMPLIQGLRIDEVRAEGERVAIEVEVPMEYAKLVALALERAARFDFMERSDGARRELYKKTGREVLEDAEVITHRPRPRVKRRPKGGKPVVITQGR